MSTRSLIGYWMPQTADRRPGAAVRAAYCHMDGYPDGVGHMLRDNYSTRLDALAVVGAGYISSLSDDLFTSMEQSFNHQPPEDFASIEEFIKAADDICAEWCYLFMDGLWHVHQVGYEHREPIWRRV